MVLKILKIAGLIGSILCALLVLIIVLTNSVVTNTGKKYCYDSIDSIPYNHCAIVLGTSKYLWNGKRNQYYTDRIMAAVDLFNNYKVDYIIVSGDNRARNYNEPITMHNDLLMAGIPSKRIILDYAGFRTLDSVVRGKEIFGQSQYTIVSQFFHNQRALYIARRRGIEAIAYNAGGVQEKLAFKVQLREMAARVLVVIDQITQKQPHFLGEKVMIPQDEDENQIDD